MSSSNLWFDIRQLKFDRYFHPSLDGSAIGAGWNEAPLLERFSCSLVEHVVARASIDLDGFGSALFIDEHAQKHPALFAGAPGAVWVSGLWGFTIARLS